MLDLLSSVAARIVLDDVVVVEMSPVAVTKAAAVAEVLELFLAETRAKDEAVVVRTERTKPRRIEGKRTRESLTCLSVWSSQFEAPERSFEATRQVSRDDAHLPRSSYYNPKLCLSYLVLYRTVGRPMMHSTFDAK